MEMIGEFALMVGLISLSGVLSPGPLFATNIFYGIKNGSKAGLKIATGHSLIEFPLILAIGFGVLSFEAFPQFRVFITILGALGLFAFAGLQIKTVLRDKKNEKRISNKHNPLIAGMIFTGLNPFFIIWWLTIGFKLISDSIAIWSMAGLLILFGVHVWMDFAWLIGTAFISGKSSRWINGRTYKIILVALSFILIYFGITFISGEFI